MTDDSASARRFDEEEVALILQRATELHREEPSLPGGSRDGLSLAELEEIAVEAGIDPRHLRRAALEVETGSVDGSVWRRLLGEVVSLSHESTLPGEIAGDDFERVVGVIQLRSREQGQPSLLGRTLTWRAETADKSRTLQVSVAVRDGTTTIRVEERLDQLAAGVFGGGLGGVGVGLGVGVGMPIGIEVLGSVLAATAFPLAVFGLAAVGAREVYRRLVGRRRRVLAELMDALVLEVRSSIGRRTPAEPDGDDASGEHTG